MPFRDARWLSMTALVAAAVLPIADTPPVFADDDTFPRYCEVSLLSLFQWPG